MRGEGQVDVNDGFREGFNCNRRPNLTSGGYNNQETRTKNLEGGVMCHTCIHAGDPRGPKDLWACPTKCLPRTFSLLEAGS